MKKILALLFIFIMIVSVMAQDENVALGKNTVASTVENTGHLSSFAVDGVPATRWSTEYTDGHTLDVDLGAVYDVERVVLAWEAAFGLVYDIQVWDGAEWITVYSETESDGGTDEITLDEPMTTQFVRMNGITRATQWGFSLYEFEVYGTTVEGADEVLSTLPASFENAEIEVLIEEEILHDFDDAEQPFTLADYWGGGTSLEIVDGALEMGLSTSGTEWQEGGFFVQPEGGLDWSAFDQVAVDVYVPAGAINFTAQIFMKTGDEWTWANIPGETPVEDEWITVVANLDSMGDASAVNEYGVKIGSSVTEFEGVVRFDNMRLLTELEIATVTEPTVLVSETLLSFEDGADGWNLADYWAGSAGVAQSNDFASDGDSSMAVTIVTTGTEWQEGGVFFNPEGGYDLTEFTALEVDIYSPEEAVGFISQIFMKTGDEWTWANTPDTPLVAGEWTTITATLADLGDMSAVNEIGVKIGSSSTEFNGEFYVDNFRLVSESTGDMMTITETLLSFEDGVDGWNLADYWAGSAGVAQSNDFASDGDSSMAVTIVTTGTEWQEGGVFFNPEGGYDLTEFTALEVDIYSPEEAVGFISQIFMKTGDEWTWANTPDTPLVAGEWTTITATLADLGDMSAVNEIGVKIGSSSTEFNSEFYVDNFRLISETASLEPITPEVYDVMGVTPLTESVGQYEKFELVVELDAQYNNPYDPIDIRLDGQFRSPDGQTIIVPGFFMEEFRTASTGFPVATGESSWRVRFAPMMTGEWEYRVLASTLTTRRNSSWTSFTVTESDNRGFVRVDERNPRYFAFDDGSPYFPVGENMAWSTGSAISDYDIWLGELSASGGNWIRVWMASWGFGLEWQDTGLGDYSNRQSQAYQLDEVIELAEANDVYIMLTLINHGQFNTTVNPEWDSNPYNVANGGMLESPIEFATNPEAARYWNQRLRYIAARYGYSTHIMTWEWWNEVNWTPLVNSDVLAPWIARSAAYLDNLDPYDRLMSHSGSPVGDESVWNQPNMDYVQDHKYNMTDVQQTFNNTIPEWLETYPDKPFLMGEFGSQSEADEDGLLLHLGLWSAPMNGAAGTGMFWWWDTYIHPNNLYYHFDGVSAFFGSEDLASTNWELTSAETSDRAGRVYGLQSDDSALLWVVNRGYTEGGYERAYQDNLRNGVDDPTVVTFDPVENLIVTVDGLQANTTYNIELWDTITGEITEIRTFTSVDGLVPVALPTFSTDIALKIKPITE